MFNDQSVGWSTLWEANDLVFAIELIVEAGGILQDAQAGLKLLEDHPDMLASLKSNIQHIYHRLSKSAEKERKTDECRIRLEWTDMSGLAQ